MTSWPVDLRGVTETVVTTLGPNDRWNVAALGVHASDEGPVTARTWGRTRTRRNFAERNAGYVQFVHDPVIFVEAALTVTERDDPILPSAQAWTAVAVEPLDRGESDGTEWVEWTLRPESSGVESTVVHTINRGHNAVIEATVAASRLDVEAYDTETLLARLRHLDDVVETCGGEREHAAMARLREQVAVDI